MKKTNISFLILFVFLMPIILLSQNHSSNWYFGEKAGINFNTSPPSLLNNGALRGHEGCSAYSDSLGNILMYTEGIEIYNRKHKRMLNGGGLMGSNSSSQNSIIIPYPSKDSLYYVFTVAANGSFGLRYSIVNMNLDTTFGGVTSIKNRLLYSFTREKLTAIKHKNGRDYWVLVQEASSNNYHAFHVSDTGIVLPSVRSTVGRVSSGWYTLKANPQGNKVVTTHAITSPMVNVFDFNNETGVLSNPIELSIPGNCLELYGAEFSPNGSVIYAGFYNCSKAIYQWNLNANSESAINASRVKLDSAGTLFNEVGAFQLGKDGRIYISRSLGTFLSTIEYPDVLGLCCGYKPMGFSLGTLQARYGLPSIVAENFKTDKKFGFEFSKDSACVGDTVKAFAISDSLINAKFYYANKVDSGNVVSLVFNSPGKYVVTMVVETKPKSDCTNYVQTDSFKKIISIGLKKSIFPSDTVTCKDTRIVFRQNVKDYMSFSWSDSTNNTDSLVVDKEGVYWALAKDTFGCEFNDTFRYTSIKFSPIQLLFDTFVCYNEVWNIKGKTPSWVNNDTTFSLGFKDSVFTINDSTFFKNFTDTGVVNLVFYQSYLNCKDSFNFNINVVPSPVVDFELNKNEFCLFDNELTPINTTDERGYSVDYKWFWGDGDTSLIKAPKHKYSLVDTFIISLQGQNQRGCKSLKNDTIIINPTPNALFYSSDSILCLSNQKLDLFSTSYINYGSLDSFYWDFGDGRKDFSENIIDLEYPNAGDYLVSLIVKSNKGCRDTSNFLKVSIKQIPNPFLLVNKQNQCLKGNIFEIRDSTIHNVNYNSYWELEGQGLYDTGQIYFFTSKSVGKFKVKQFSKDIYGCADSTYLNIEIYPQSKLSFVTDTVCFKDSFEFVSSSTVDSGYIKNWEWEMGNGEKFIGERILYSHPLPGSYNIRLITETDRGCIDTLSNQSPLTVLEPHNPVLVSSGPECAFRFITFENKTVEKEEYKPYRYNINWYGTEVENNNTIFDLIPQDTGSQKSKIKSTDKFGCKDSADFYFRVINNPIANISANDFTQCLKGNLFNFKNNSKSTGELKRTEWFIQENGFNSSGQEISYSFNESGKASIRLIVEDSFGCIDTIIEQIDIYPQSKLDFVTDTVCFRQVSSISSKSLVESGALILYSWDLGNGQKVNGENVNYTYNYPGIYSIKLFTETNNGCKDSLEKTNILVVRDLPGVSFNYEILSDSVKSSHVLFNGNSSGKEPFLYNWKFDNLGDSEEKNPLFWFHDTGKVIVSLKVTDSFGCENEMNQTLFLMPKVLFYMPNAFSPNNDFSNDHFKPIGLEYSLDYRMEIYNRWGELIFKTKELNMGWNGVFQHKEVPEGVYIYKIFIKDVFGKNHYLSGTVTLLR